MGSMYLLVHVESAIIFTIAILCCVLEKWKTWNRVTGNTISEFQYFVERCKKSALNCNEEHWLSASPDDILNGDTLLEIKCPMPVPNKWNTIEELINGGKYEVIKTTKGQCKLKVKGSRGYANAIDHVLYRASKKQTLCVEMSARLCFN